MKIKKISKLLLCMLMVICLSAIACAKTNSDDAINLEMSSEEATEYVLDEIEKIILEGDQNCAWNSSTKPYICIPLYDYDDNCIGYIFKLSTDNKETGYIQINTFNGEAKVYCYSFDGIPAYEGLTSNNIETIEENDKKLYFFGNMNYCLKSNDNNFELLGTSLEYNKNSIISFYETYIEQVKTQREEQAVSDDLYAETNSVSRTVQNFTPVEMDDFANIYATRPNGTQQKVTDYCAPTAATNIMLYFRSTGESNLSKSLSKNTIFIELYYAMDTNSISSSNEVLISGTTRSNIKKGINTFAKSRNCSPSSLGTITSVTLSNMKSKIDNGNLLQVSVNDFEGTSGGHSIVSFGYNGSKLKVYTGWDKSEHSYSYSDLSISQFVYVGY